MSNVAETKGEASTLAGWMPLSQWVEEHGGAFFSTKASIEWFIKLHRLQLIEADALLPREGRAGSLVSVEKFPQAVLGILKKRALERSAA
jgi:hypothetical protein